MRLTGKGAGDLFRGKPMLGISSVPRDPLMAPTPFDFESRPGRSGAYLARIIF